MAAAAKRQGQRTHLTLQQKAKLQSFLMANPELAQSDVAVWVLDHFHVRLGRTTLYRIQHAPKDAYATGNLRQKKQRRVKFPNFETRLVDFYTQKGKAHVPDDVLLRHAAECRAACGITASELKLSNGWLYRFKIRHELSGIPLHAKCQEKSNMQENSLAAGPVLPVVHALSRDQDTGATLCKARALTTLQGPGFFTWEPVSKAHYDHVVLVPDSYLCCNK